MVSRQQTSRLMSRLLPLLLLGLLLLLLVEEVLLLDAMMTVPGVTLDPTNGLLLAVSLQWTKLTKAEMKLGFCSENSPTPGAAATTPLTSRYSILYLHIYTLQSR